MIIERIGRAIVARFDVGIARIVESGGRAIVDPAQGLVVVRR